MKAAVLDLMAWVCAWVGLFMITRDPADVMVANTGAVAIILALGFAKLSGKAMRW